MISAVSTDMYDRLDPLPGLFVFMECPWNMTNEAQMEARVFRWVEMTHTPSGYAFVVDTRGKVLDGGKVHFMKLVTVRKRIIVTLRYAQPMRIT